jgi:two-component system CheB/CheR fusion protein
MSHPPADFLVVGVGASAGGVEALQAFFAQVSPASGCAYVVILHLSPEHESNLAPILQAVTPLPVTVVTEQVRVESDHVYVVPPNQHLAVVDDEVRVSPNTEPEARRAPIDIFFRTLAESHQRRGVCVILSGSGTDGSMGLKRVKERGGAVFVQSPRETTFAEMPRSAIATDLVDAVLPVAEIPARIIAYRASLGAVAIPEEPEQRPQEQQQALREIFALLRAHTGHDFANYKRATLLRRIERRISVRNLPGLEAYAAVLRGQPDEVQALLKDLLISVTNFFRDKEAFAALEQEILPRIFAGKGAGDTVRVWVAGCATGEEAYSVAMLCAERALDVLDAPAVQVFATDIGEAAVARARAGLYTPADVADVSPERLRRFFTLEDERYRVRPELRERILFAHHNLLADPPFSHLDLVTCRNVLIYLNRTAQERVIEIFHLALEPGGFLFLGNVESADGASDLFTVISREHRLFQRRPAAPQPLPLPLSGPPPRPAAARPPALPAPDAAAAPQPREPVNYGGLHLHLLEQYAPPSLLVDQDFTVVHVSERAGRYLQIGAGEPTRHLLELVRPELRVELRSALYQALQRQTSVDTPPLPAQIEGYNEQVTIRVRPALLPDTPARGLLLVLFEPSAAAAGEAALVVRADEPATRALEEEAARLRLQLRSSSEQYEYQAEELRATNEEQQALVEELRASSEELHTSKEELQATNEELRTVNQELKVKIEEATQTSANLRNLVNSTDIATIFLDRQQRVRLFTPAARTLFNLIPADYGRPLSDLTHQLGAVDVLADAETVFATLQPVEREVRTTDGRAYVLRVLPYRAAEDRIGGVVLTFFDITARTLAEAAVRASEEQFRRAIEEAPIPVIMHAEDGEVLQISRSWTELTGYTLADVPTLDAWLSRAYGHGADAVRSHMHALFAGEQRSLNVAFEIGTRAGALRHWSFSASSPGALRDGRRFVVGMALDITERARAERTLAEQARLLDLSNDAIIVRDVDNRIVYWNRGASELYGWTREQAVGQDLHTLLQTEFEAPLPELIAVLQKHDRMEGEVVQVTRDGRRLTLLCRWALDRDAASLPGAILTTYNDISERKRAEERQSYILRLSDALRPLGDPVAVQAAVTHAAREFFNADRCYYCEIAQGNAIIRRDSSREGLPSVVGVYDLGSMPILRAVVDAGQPFMVRDAYTTNLLDAELKELCIHMQIISFLNVPVTKAGRPVGVLCITQSAPREWTAFEVELAVETAERTWAAVERARAEEALRDSEARFRTLADTVPQVIWANDAAGNAIYFNQRWYAYSGLSYEQSAGPGWQAIAHPDDAPASRERWQQALAAGTVFDSEYRLRRADGVYRWHLGRNVPLRDEQGRITGWFGSATDIEELKQAEAARRESAVLRRLAEAQEEERLRIARDLHDQLGQLITGLLLGLKQLEAQVASSPAAATLAPLQALALELARESHRIAVSLRPTALEDVGLVPALERLVAEWSRAAAVQAAFVSSLPGQDRLPRPVEVALFRTVQEALTNVQKHAAATVVSVALQRIGELVALVVEDNGRGFDLEAPAADARPRLGVLGMRERVGQLGGTLEVESTQGRGTTLFVRIPLDLPAPAAGGSSEER